MSALLADYDTEQIRIDCRAFWYSERISGNLKIQFETYKNGNMTANGYDFINVGGSLVQSITIDVNSKKVLSDGKEGELLAYLTFNNRQKIGALTIVNPSIDIDEDLNTVNNLSAESDLSMAKVNLNWTNVSLSKGTQYIQRSLDSSTWEDIGIAVNYAGGNSYTAEDSDIFFENETTLYYRIAMSTSSGTEFYGNVVSVVLPAGSVTDLNATLEE